MTETDVVSYAERIRQLAAEAPQDPLVTVGRSNDSVTMTRAEFDRATNAMGRHLASLGASTGDFVTIAEPNSIEFMVAVAACWKIGAIPQPVSSRLPGRELDAIIELADSVVVVGIEHDQRAGVPLGFRPVDVDDGPLPDAISPAWKAPTSGGSTGRPKLIVSGDPSEWEPFARSEGIGATADATMLIPGPLYHNGPFIWAFTTLLAGGHVVVMPRFDAEDTLAHIEANRVTSMYLVPTMMQRIWKLPDESKFGPDISSLRRAVHLAEPCPEWLKEVWLDWVGPDVLWELYGGTEGQASTLLSGHEWLEHRGSVGKAISGEIIIFDDDGNEVPRGERGSVWMRPVDRDRPTYYYLGAEPERRGDWECLGDIGWMDEDGYLYLADRRNDMILVGGANVYPAEVEAAIAEHPSVQSVAVIGLPDDDKGQRVHAIVQATADDDLSASLVEFLSERLVRYKMPRTFEFVDTPLRDDAGKVRRAALRAERMEASP